MLVNFPYRDRTFSAEVDYNVPSDTKIVKITIKDLRDADGIPVEDRTPWWNSVQSHIRKSCFHGKQVASETDVAKAISALSL